MQNRLLDLHLFVLHALLWEHSIFRVIIGHIVPNPLIFFIIFHTLLYVLHDRICYSTVRQRMQSLADHLLWMTVGMRYSTEFDISLDRDPSESIRFHAQDLRLLEELRVNFVIPRCQHHLWQEILIQISNG